MGMVSLDKFLAAAKKEMGETEFNRRDKICDNAFERVECFLKSEEGKELEPETDAAISFYRTRVKVLGMSLLSEDLFQRFACMDALILLRAIQELIKSGKMT